MIRGYVFRGRCKLDVRPILEARPLGHRPTTPTLARYKGKIAQAIDADDGPKPVYPSMCVTRRTLCVRALVNVVPIDEFRVLPQQQWIAVW